MFNSKNQYKDIVDKIFSKNKKCNLISIATVFEGVDSIYENFLDLIKKMYSKIELIKDEELKINFISDTTAIKEEGDWKIVHIYYSKN